jgi:DNA-binding transcriptional regulator YhcF (GntR family)
MKKSIFNINPKSAVPKYRQVVDTITSAIEEKILVVGDKLPSISQLCVNNTVKRDTVMYALNELKAKGIITSQQGKGYYIASTDVKITDRYFLLFDELNAYSGAIYNNLMSLLPVHSSADIFFHHNDPCRIQELLEKRNGAYTAYILLCSGLENYSNLTSKLPNQHTCMIGKQKKEYHNAHCVFHDYDKDFYESLRTLRKNLKKYCRLIYLDHNTEISVSREEGFKRFCTEEKFDYLICNNPESLRPALYEAYFVPEDDILVKLIGKIQKSGLIVGENIGIVSFIDSQVKEITAGGLTVITPDYKDICNRLIEITKGRKRGQLRARVNIIQRNSI